MTNTLKDLIKQMVKDEEICCADCLHEEVQEAYDEAIDEKVEAEMAADTLSEARVAASLALTDYLNLLFDTEFNPEEMENTLKEMEEDEFTYLKFLLSNDPLAFKFKIKGLF